MSSVYVCTTFVCVSNLAKKIDQGAVWWPHECDKSKHVTRVLQECCESSCNLAKERIRWLCDSPKLFATVGIGLERLRDSVTSMSQEC
jgi:hypothetical protein